MKLQAQRIEQRTAQGIDFRNSDTTGYTDFADVTLVANKRVLIGEMPITDFPDAKALGFGGGKIFWEVMDDTTTAVREEGTLVLAVVSRDGSEKEVMRMSSRDCAPDGQENTPSEQTTLPRLSPAGTKSLRLYFVSDAADTIDTTDCLFYKMPFYVVY